MEQEEYTREQINWSYIEFVDNQDVLDLIEKVWVGYYIRCIALNLASGKKRCIAFAVTKVLIYED